VAAAVEMPMWTAAILAAVAASVQLVAVSTEESPAEVIVLRSLSGIVDGEAG
jgi:hypothetical protein